MAKNDVYELTGNMSGLSESPICKMEDDGKVDVVYEAERCTSAWLEVDEEGVKRKIPILPNARNGSVSNKPLKKDTEFKVVAAIGRGGFFRAHLYY